MLAVIGRERNHPNSLFFLDTKRIQCRNHLPGELSVLGVGLYPALVINIVIELSVRKKLRSG